MKFGMTFHSARNCLLRKKQGILCQKKDCIARQTVLQKYFKYLSTTLIQQTVRFKIVKKGVLQTPLLLDGEGSAISERGRPLLRTFSKQDRNRSNAIRGVRRPQICGGGRTEQIVLSRYVETLRLTKTVLKPTIGLLYEAPVISRFYYGKANVSDKEILNLWKYHRRNFHSISREYKTCIGEMHAHPASPRKETEHVAAYTANICWKIIDGMIAGSHVEERQKLAAAVCSKIAQDMHAKHQNKSVRTADKIAIESCEGIEKSLDAPHIPHDSLGSFSDALETATELSPECRADEGKSPENPITHGIQESDTKVQGTVDDTFQDFGISEKLAGVLSNSNITGGKSFLMKIDSNERIIALDPTWRNLPIKSSKDGARHFGGEWTNYFNKAIANENPYCVFAFKRNYIKKAISRKQKSPFFKSNGVCTIPPCKCKVFLSIPEENRDVLKVYFLGDVEHTSSILKSRRITGSERDTIRKEMQSSGMKPSTLHRKKLRGISEEGYAGGNRSGCGVTAKAFQHISSEVINKQNNPDTISAKIRTSDQIIRKDNRTLFKKIMETQKITGFVRSNDITNDSLSVVLFDEGCVRLYRHICTKDVLFFDATGTIIEKIKGFKRILLYSLTTRDPLRKCPPIPVAEMISSTHSAGAIQRLFALLREQEKLLYGDNLQPFAIRTDFSGAIIAACVTELNNGMSVNKYIDRCYDILTGVSQDDCLTLVLICSAHIMKMNAKKVEAFALKKVASENRGSVKHLAMRIVGVMVNTEKLEDAFQIIKLAYISFMSQYVTPQLNESLNCLSEIVNEFRVDIEAIEKKGIFGTDCHDDNLEGLGAIGSLPTPRNKFQEHLQKELGIIDLAQDEGQDRNKYFLPAYMDYFCTILVPHLPLWTRIMLSMKHSLIMKKPLIAAANLVGKRVFDIGNTNAHAENYFTFVKQSFTVPSVPIDEFIYKHFENVEGLRRQYIDSLRVGTGKGNKKGENAKCLRQLERSTPRYPNDAHVDITISSDAEEEEEEQWYKPPANKRSCRISGHYSEPPTTPISFKTARIKGDGKYKKNENRGIVKKEDKMRFHVFKVKNWSSISPKIKSTEGCLDELQRRYLRLSAAERKQIPTPRSHSRERYCICKQPFDASGPSMVQCNICEEWYHSTCIGMESDFLSTMIPRYHCKICAQTLFRGLSQYICHYDDKMNDETSELIKGIYDEFDNLDSKVKLLIYNHNFTTNASDLYLPSLTLLGHRRGIRNEKNNCWLSSMIHVICGTGLIDVLLSYEGSNNLALTGLLHLCRVRLAKVCRTHLTLKMIQDVAIKLDESVTKSTHFDPTAGLQRDASEFYSNVITYYLENILSDRIMNDLQFVCLDLRHCLNCKGMSGSVHRNTMFSIGVLDSMDPICLTDLIWSQMLGKYYEESSYQRSVCFQRCQTTSVWEASFVKSFPSVLAIQLIRTKGDGSGRIVQTPVVVPQKMDLTSYHAKITSATFKYTLVAVVSHYAYTTGSGHYATHLFKNDIVQTYDDTTLKSRKADNILTLPAFQKAVHMLFYFLDPDSNTEDIARDAPRISRCEERVVEKYWFGLLEPSSSQVTAHDLRTVCNGKLLNGAVISHFLFAAAKKFEERRILTVSTTFYENVCDGRLTSSEVSSFLSNAELHDIIIVPINIEERHWIVSSIYPKARCIVIIDSQRDPNQGRPVFEKMISLLLLHADSHGIEFYAQDWILIHPRTLPLQNDSHSCGVFACMNGVNCMLPGRFYIPKPQNMSLFRYWIVHIASNTNAIPTFRRQPLKNKFKVHLLDERKNNLMIRDSVPGHGRTVFFFEALKRFIEQRVQISNGNKDCFKASRTVQHHASYEQDADSFIEEPTTNEFLKRNDQDSALNEGEDLQLDNSMNDIKPDDGANFVLTDESELSSGDSHDLERKAVHGKLLSLRHLKEKLLQRLVLDSEHGNERYIVLALLGKSKLHSLFSRELDVISHSMRDEDLEMLKGALYQLFCNTASEHQYFQITLPTIQCERYGFTSAQFIDYIILPDAICLDYMDVKEVSYEDAVSNTCGENKSRLTVYWNHALCKDRNVKVQKVVAKKYYIQGVLNDIEKERANVIVIEVNSSLKPTNKISEKIMKRGCVTTDAIERSYASQNLHISSPNCIACGPGELKCDKIILTVCPELQTETKRSTEILRRTINCILTEASCKRDISISMPLLYSLWGPAWKEFIAVNQVDIICQYLRDSVSCSLAVVRIVTESNDDYEIIKYGVFS